jgi:SNF2 family DNA or RNA helicase
MQTNLQQSSNETLSPHRIQNNLKELWAVVNWATSGRLLAHFPNFKNKFSIPIKEGRHKNASKNAMRRADLANNALQEQLCPHYLQ